MAVDRSADVLGDLALEELQRADGKLDHLGAACHLALGALSLGADEARETWQLARQAAGVSGTVFQLPAHPRRHRDPAPHRRGRARRAGAVLIQYQCDYAADPLPRHSSRY